MTDLKKPKEIDYPLEHTEKLSIKRFTLKGMWADILAIFELEKGVLYTIYGLFRKPAYTIYDYLGEGRFRYSNPFRLLAVLAALGTLLTANTGLLDTVSAGFSDGLYGDDAGPSDFSVEFSEL